MFGRLVYAAITMVATATIWCDREHPRLAICPSTTAPSPSDARYGRLVSLSGTQREARLFRVHRHYMVNTATISR